MASIAQRMQAPALRMIRAQGQAVTLRRKRSGSVAAEDGSITPAHTDYSGFAVFGETGRSKFGRGGTPREVAANREVGYLAAKGFGTTPTVGDVLYRAATAVGTPQRVEAVEATMPGAVAVLWRLELAR